MSLNRQSLSQQEACDFVIGRLSATLAPRRPSLSDLAPGALVVALTLSIAAVGCHHAINATNQLLSLGAYERIEARFASLERVERSDESMAGALQDVSATAAGSSFRRR